jgi:hypothetical protein
LITTLPALAALAWMVYGFINISRNLAYGHTLQQGIYIELAAVVAIAAITVSEMIIGLREREAQPDASQARTPESARLET